MKKLIATIGLAVTATLALTAFLGASTASATVCSTTGTGAACTSGKAVAEGSTVVAKANGTIALTSGFINVTCDESEFVQKLGKDTGGGITHSLIIKLTIDHCHSNANQTTESCTVVTTAATTSWAATASAIGAGQGKLVVSNVTMSFSCLAFGSNTKCNYSAATVGNGATPELVVTGSDTAPKVTASNVALTKEEGSGFLCSNTATWEGTYNVTSPASLWLF